MNHRTRFLLILLPLLLTACAVREGERYAAAWPPPVPVAKTSITLNTGWSSTVDGKQSGMQMLPIPPHIKKLTLDTYESSRLFAAIREGQEPADHYIDLRITDNLEDYPRFIATSFVMFLSLLTIPAVEKHCLYIEARIRDNHGKEYPPIEHNACLTHYFSIFALPMIGTENSVPEGVYTDLNRQVILDALEKGYLD